MDRKLIEQAWSLCACLDREIESIAGIESMERLDRLCQVYRQAHARFDRRQKGIEKKTDLTDNVRRSVSV